MPLIYFFIIILVFIVLALVGFVFSLKKIFGKWMKQLIEENSEKTVKMSKEILSSEGDRMKEIMSEKMDSNKQYLDSKKDAIKDLVEKISEDIAKNQTKSDETKTSTLKELNTLKTVIEEHKVATGGLRDATDHLKNILSNNQLRGKYGEEVAENLLRSVGFVKGQHYSVNTGQESVSTRPDFTMFLPDKTRMNIDAKFPLQSLIRYQEAESKLEKDRYLREFTTDVKQKIKQVATRDYINPEEDTVDFVILFVPNEMIFSFIYDKLHEVWNDAMKQKVIMAGPFSFTAILRMVFQSYKNFSYQKNLHSIIKLINSFTKEYESFSGELDTLGKRIQSVESQYNTVSVTRAKKLTGVVEKIKSEDILSETQNNELIE
ncbi:MAG: DNA recombination protein RmuC [Candidatus Moranbacteria bacterium]|nr:DNA recombination protein RmuC [Candidatus Moranbacteria bacterium]